MTRILIAVIGGRSSARAAEEAAAEAVGREIAARGAALVCGGLSGIMEAACRGAKSANGLTIGILPGDSAGDANPFVDVAIPTGMGFSRNFLVASAGQGVIAVGGSVGTLSEMAFALVKGLPVATLGSWKLEPKRLQRDDRFYEASSAKDAADYVFTHLGGGR